MLTSITVYSKPTYFCSNKFSHFFFLTLDILNIPNFCSDLFSRKFLPHEYCKSKPLMKLNRLTVSGNYGYGSFDHGFNKTYKMTCACNKDSDRSAYPCSLRCRPEYELGPWILLVCKLCTVKTLNWGNLHSCPLFFPEIILIKYILYMYLNSRFIWHVHNNKNCTSLWLMFSLIASRQIFTVIFLRLLTFHTWQLRT